MAGGRPKTIPHCTLEGCSLAYYALGYCKGHYWRVRKHGDPGSPEIERRRKSCSVDGCVRPAAAKELCNSHYARWKQSGVWPVGTIRPTEFKGKVGPCLRPGCTKESRGSGYCLRHYARLRLLMNLYGFEGWDDFDAFWERCGGKCGICGTELDPEDKDTHIDHCHRTGKVRGLLCGHHNRGLGYFNDDPELLECAALYLRQCG